MWKTQTQRAEAFACFMSGATGRKPQSFLEGDGDRVRPTREAMDAAMQPIDYVSPGERVLIGMAMWCWRDRWPVLLHELTRLDGEWLEVTVGLIKEVHSRKGDPVPVIAAMKDLCGGWR